METREIKLIKKKKNNKVVIIIFTFILCLFILVGLLLTYYYLPYFQKVEINSSNEIQLYYMGELMEQVGYENENVTYLPYNFIKEFIDPEIKWDENGKFAIITTTENVFHFPLGRNEGLLNLEPYTFTYPLIEYNGNVYIPVDPISNYYDIEIEYFQEEAILIIHDLKQPILQGTIIKDAKIRTEAKLNSPSIEDIIVGTKISIMKEVNGWYWIEDGNGLIGYVNKHNVQLLDIKTSLINKNVYQPWNPIGKPIQLIWEYTNKYSTIDIKKIGDITGVQVVSPTWFNLQEDGLIENIADKEYITWAHNNSYQVWALFTNSFDPELTHEMLTDANLRIKVIKQLLTYVDLYQLDGINIDFENIYLKDKDLLVQFIRELTPLLHEKNRTVSMDVTFKSLSENWSLFYDRKRLGEIVDYIIVMGYDEHWAASPVAGSVSSIPWVEKGLKGILEEVPNDKVILAVPLYTRLWTEETDEQGNVKVSSKTFTMDTVDQWIRENNANIEYDEKSGQNYVEVNKGSTNYKIWIEDELSMQKRIDLMNKYHLAGIAAWRRGFESKDFWTTTSSYITEKP
ncbi:MAG: glycosyl hydrolase family 18 protein [Vulcanibacillus sp.]